MLLSVLYRHIEPFRPPQRAAPIRPRQVAVMMYFPPLRPGGRGAGGKPDTPDQQKTVSTRPVSSMPAAPSATSRVARPDGLVYPGPQQVLSDPPMATNAIQTISQPAFHDLPTLKPPIALPNMVLLADAAPSPQPAPPEPAVPQPDPVKPEPEPVKPLTPEEVSTPAEAQPVEPQAPVLHDALAPTVPDPVLPLPAPRADSRVLMTVPPPAPAPPTPALTPPTPAPEIAKAAPKEPPKDIPPLEFSPEPTRGPDARNFLALTPMPAATKAPVQIPFGEARGHFAISPQPNLSTPATEPPSTLGPAPPEPPSSTPVAVTTPASVAVAGPPKVVTVSFGGPSGAKTPGPGGTGRQSSGAPGVQAAVSPGGGPGSGSGSSPVAEAGSGSGAGKSPFSGITVVGGPGGAVSVAGAVPRIRAARPLQTSYGVSVVSTESSGGGLPFSGVFASGQIHTVYLDMRKTETDTAPSWTLEFAVPQQSAARVTLAGQAGGSQQGLVLPFPAVKKQPVLPREVVVRHLREMIIVYGVLNAEGKLDRLSIKKSPDPLLAAPVLEALTQWAFRPAMLDGAPISVEVLLGIPVWSAE